MTSIGFAYAFNSDTKTILASRMRVADTHRTRLVGLIGTPPEAFQAGEGLWIVPCHGVHTFLMRFPIDVLYLTAERRVHHIEENVRPWRVTPMLTEAATVLELPAHTVFNTATRIGDLIELHVPARETAA
jgi:uncharacterized membrane protein (UPF0127 family)